MKESKTMDALGWEFWVIVGGLSLLGGASGAVIWKAISDWWYCRSVEAELEERRIAEAIALANEAMKVKSGPAGNSGTRTSSVSVVRGNNIDIYALPNVQVHKWAEYKVPTVPDKIEPPSPQRDDE